MAADPFTTLRLGLMQQALPVGAAVLERLRRGGPGELAAVLQSGAGNPLETLRQEGEPVAGRWRERLDQLSPGLGNPVMPVEVREVDAAPAPSPDLDCGVDPDPQALATRLGQIAARLSLLQQRLQQRD